MGLASRRRQAARAEAQLIQQLVLAAKASIDLNTVAAELAERCMDAAEGKTPLTPMDLLDCRANVRELQNAIDTVRGFVTRVQRALGG